MHCKSNIPFTKRAYKVVDNLQLCVSELDVSTLRQSPMPVQEPLSDSASVSCLHDFSKHATELGNVDAQESLSFDDENMSSAIYYMWYIL